MVAVRAVVLALLTVGVHGKQCETQTGGTCMIFRCNLWRHSVCNHSKCVCDPGTCAVDGACEKDIFVLGKQDGHVADIVITKNGRVDNAAMLKLFAVAAAFGMVIAMVRGYEASRHDRGHAEQLFDARRRY